MDTLTTMRTDVDSLGRDQLMQTANLTGTLAQGFGAVNSITQSVAAQLAQGQSRTEAAVLTTGLNGQLSQKDNVIAQLGATHANEVQALRNTFDIVSSQKDCCCNMQKLILFGRRTRSVERGSHSFSCAVDCYRTSLT